VLRTILVLGASGLIGRFLTDDLRVRGFRVIGVARDLARAQKMSPLDLELPLLSLDVTALMHLLSEHAVDVVVNCVGVLQDGPGSNTMVVHRDFVARLLRAINASDRAIRLVQMSIPGLAGEDYTAFATSKREAEGFIVASGVHHAILRPGFVVAPSAYGGSALLRALAAWPIDLPSGELTRRFQPVAVEDVSATVAWLAEHDPEDKTIAGVTWDLMQKEPMTLAEVIGQWRRAYGTDGRFRFTMPEFLVELGAGCGDLAGRIGWKSPMRSTAIAELRRGVLGDPLPWIAATGIEPKTLAMMIGQHPATIQDKWFARLYLVKALIIVTLSLFWIVSGFVALFVSYRAAADILGSRGMPPELVDPVLIGTSLLDMIVGGLIAVRRTSALGLAAGIVVSLGYIVSAIIMTPELWIEPLGSLVKIGPAIVLMLLAFLLRDNR